MPDSPVGLDELHLGGLELADQVLHLGPVELVEVGEMRGVDRALEVLQIVPAGDVEVLLAVTILSNQHLVARQ